MDFPGTQALHGLEGGVLIGLAAALMLLGAGRIAGVSGIAARAAGLAKGDMAMTDGRPAELAPWPVMVIAGLVVGIATRMGSGCTSGHGVCGVRRFSPRSMIATATFIGAGIVTVFILSRIGGAS